MSMIEKMIETANESTKQRKVVKTFPCKSEWLKVYKKYLEKAEDISIAMAELKTLKNKFWADIEISIGNFSGDKKYNPETNEIEILAPED